ncbi:hypothetical protein HDK64DRAFT_261922 [Phyllosticta capitalensis]
MPAQMLMVGWTVIGTIGEIMAKREWMDGHAFQHHPTVFTSLLPNQLCWLLSTARSDFLHAKIFLFSISSPSTHSLLISYIPYPTEYLPNQPPAINR